MAEFPGSVPTDRQSATTEYLNNMAGGFGHVGLHNFHNNEIIALATKLGTGASTPSSGNILRGTGAGASAWGQIDLATDLATFTSAQLASRLTDETGSGAAMFGTAPTLSNPTITGGGSWAGSPSLLTPTIADFTNATHNHTNAGGGGTLSTNALQDSAVTGAKISTYKIVRQDDTSNSTETAARILTGWGVLTPGVASTGTEAITFNSAFSVRPIVTVTYGGDSAASTTYGDGGINVKDGVIVIAHTITTTGFTINIKTRDATNYAAGNTVFYQWIAIGN